MSVPSLRDGRAQLALAALAVAGLTGVSALVLGGPTGSSPAAAAPGCSAPDVPGTVVTVTATDMGGRAMMGGAVMPGGMRLTLDRTSVLAGVVSIVVVDTGALAHETVVLPLPAGSAVATRTVGGDGTVEEADSLAEASSSCGAGSGSGIAPGASGWVTATLPAGTYELVCNLPGHYAAGMHVVLTVV